MVDQKAHSDLNLEKGDTPILQKRLFTFLLSKDVPPIPTEQERNRFLKVRQISFQNRIYMASSYYESWVQADFDPRGYVLLDR